MVKNILRNKYLVKQRLLAIMSLGLFSVAVPASVVLAQTQSGESQSQLRLAITNENDRIFVNTLIKSSLISLNQANQTNNYSVVRALGSPGFQNNNSEQDLRDIFTGIREAGLDFSAISEYEPLFSSDPVLDESNSLLVQGHFPTNPNIEFNLLYQLVNGQFRVDTFTVGIQPVVDSAQP
ncbi:MAG: hypothetical protein HC799_03975 [Limnothrix sp. RL_2_0]|nr:hypothetical protein [Limnothrix sp. RL_2_0]